MKSLPALFVASATVFAIAGMLYGMHMAGSQDHTLYSAHAHNNLLGWVGMAIFGLFYQVFGYPAGSRLPMVHYWIAMAGNLIFPIGIARAILGQGDLMAALGGGLHLISMGIFAFIVWRMLLARQG